MHEYILNHTFGFTVLLGILKKLIRITIFGVNI